METTFRCKYLTPSGEVKNDKLKFFSEEDILPFMQQNQYLLISYHKDRSVIQHLRAKAVRPLNNKELTEFCDQLFFVFHSGTNLIEGLYIIKNDNDNQKVSEILSRIHQEVERGNTLSDAMKVNEGMFPALLLNMVESGEVSGNLDGIFSQMKDYYEKQGQVGQKVKMALIQPVILLLIGMGISFYFLRYALPDLMSNLDIEENQLPALTKSMLFMSDFLAVYGVHLLFGIILLFIVFYFLKQVQAVRYQLDKALMKIPIVGNTLRYLETFRVAMALHLFVRSDVSILTALEVLENLMTNQLAKESISDAKQSLIEGGSLVAGFNKNRFFGDKFIKYMEIGEETGNLEEVLGNLASHFKNKIDETIEKSLKNLEPILTVVMSVVVGVVVMAIAMPIFSMVDYVQ